MSEPLLPAPPYARQRLSTEAVERLTEFGRKLATDGVLRGLIGPREVPRLWDRHLLNCAAMSEAIAPKSFVADIGTGAGLPGLVLALIRPDLRLCLVDTLQRRCDFLNEMVHDFSLTPQVNVVWGRAEETPSCEADIVTARAVANLGKLAPWCLPHVRVGGQLLVMKGQKAAEELSAARKVLRRWGADKDARLITCGAGWIDPAITLVAATRTR